MVEKSEIVKAAAAVFAAQGLGATLAEVARTAGVGVATVYRRFPTKDDLILEVYADRFAAVEQDARRACALDDPWDGVVTFFEDSVQRLAADRGFREFVLGTYRQTIGWSRRPGPGAARIEDLVLRTQGEVRTMAEQLVKRAHDAGVLRADVDAGDMFLLTMAVQSVLEAGGPDHPAPWRRVAAIVLDGLRVNRADPAQGGAGQVR